MLRCFAATGVLAAFRVNAVSYDRSRRACASSRRRSAPRTKRSACWTALRLLPAGAVGGRRRRGRLLELLTQLLNRLVRSKGGTVGGGRRGLRLVARRYRISERALGVGKILLGLDAPLAVGCSRWRRGLACGHRFPNAKEEPRCWPHPSSRRRSGAKSRTDSELCNALGQPTGDEQVRGVLVGESRVQGVSQRARDVFGHRSAGGSRQLARMLDERI